MNATSDRQPSEMYIAAETQPLPRRWGFEKTHAAPLPRRGRFQNLIPRRCRDADVFKKLVPRRDGK